ncbi:hypothetical protein NDU88_002687 [Pleurodeles waltl]|uniref:Uncharacterized protein n=1 Tax=Pleurodeles waltl TaxID=8319 RepID=A0AAV7VF39_PLEWA|nr:hypothetical protein NDU88_002687 [Pleurodeles waltl]
MARVTGKRAHDFTLMELEHLVDEVLPQFGQLYGPPNKQVSTPWAQCMWEGCMEMCVQASCHMWRGMSGGSVHGARQVMCEPMDLEMGIGGHMYDRLDCMCNDVLLSILPQQVSAHQKKGLWRAITMDMWMLEVYNRWSTHCRKQWKDLRCWARKTAEAQLGMASQLGRGAHRNLTPPLVARILAVAYPELDWRLRASQQPQGGEYSGHYFNHWLVAWDLGGDCELVGAP